MIGFKSPAHQGHRFATLYGRRAHEFCPFPEHSSAAKEFHRGIARFFQGENYLGESQ